MPKIKNIKKILIIGSGPIIIGQGAEFDYSSTQACLAIKELGIKTVFVNSNPATINTDENIADKVYMEPLSFPYLKEIILKEKPCAVIGSFGGQTGLNLIVSLHKSGILDEVNCKILGTSIKSIEYAEDRDKFIKICKKINEKCVESEIANSEEQVFEIVSKLKFPIILRPAFTLGGSGGGVYYNLDDLKVGAKKALNMSPNNQVLVEKFIVGYKEIEYEIIRDSKDNAICVCNMENIEPVGVHTGDSIVIAPSQTLSNKEFQAMRSSAIKIIRELKVEGACNVQFAFNPITKEYYVIEVNPRVSRSSALASKATGYPIAKVSALIICGLALDEIKLINTPASFEPALDYVVTKIPRFPFDKFVDINNTLSTQMKSTGEVMGIGRTFEESFLKAIRSLEIKKNHIYDKKFTSFSVYDLFGYIKNFRDDTIFAIAQILRFGDYREEISRITKIDIFFINKIKNIIDFENKIKNLKINITLLKMSKKMGFSDEFISFISKSTLSEIFELRKKNNIFPVYKMIDTCASEFESYVPFFYSTYNACENESISQNDFDSSKNDDLRVDFKKNKKKIIILGSGPIRIGQGIEFDYSSVHAALSLKELNYEVIIINNNPSTVSTDYTFTNKLYFEPLTVEDIINIVELEKPYGIIVTLGGQTPVNLSGKLADYGCNILGNVMFAISTSEDRQNFEFFLKKLNIEQPRGMCIQSLEEGIEAVKILGFPVLIRPSFVLGGLCMRMVKNENEFIEFLNNAIKISENKKILIDKYVRGKELEVDALTDGNEVFIPGIIEHIERGGVHSGDSVSVYPAFSISDNIKKEVIDTTIKIGLNLKFKGIFNVQFIVTEEKLFVIEVNVRSSRTVPFLAKSAGINLAKICAKVQVGIDLNSQKEISEFKLKNNYFHVKFPVFSFEKIDSDIYLSPEMKSTGEAKGQDRDFNKAFLKAFTAVGYENKNRKSILISIGNSDKDEILPIVQLIIEMNFKIYATEGTFDFLKNNNIDVTLQKKTGDDFNEILNSICDKKYEFIINTQSIGVSNTSKGFLIRRKAIENKIMVFTSLDTVKVFLTAIKTNFKFKNNY